LERARARQLRAEGWTLAAIASEVGASKGSVSGWVRDVAFERRRSRAAARRRGPNVLERRKADEIATLLEEGRARVGLLSERDLLIAGVALYAGEGSKRDGAVCFTNADARMVSLFCRWLRRFFEIDETRLRVRLYLHAGLDVEAATAHWAAVAAVRPTQFRKPYRAVADPTRRSTKHPMGIASVTYSCSKTHRQVMGLVAALLTSVEIPG
jgi:hypothetical protein